ncbi:MAG: hypothetical protein MSS69_06360 [Spirochaetales bacterium]|nr:hypothetical protein [Spirochaetales bacterium]
MKDPLLLLLLVMVGVFLYLATFKGVIYPWFLLCMVVVTGLWYIANHYISRKMVQKSRNDEEFFYQNAQMIDKTGTELISGALIVTKDEVVFVERKGYFGGVKVVWSAFTSTISSYSFDYVTEKKLGLKLNLKREKEEVKFVAPKMQEREKEFRKSLGWPEE